MGVKKIQENWNSTYLNNRTYQYYYQRLTDLAISMFEWKNLPPTIDARFLELTLYSDGMAVFFEDADLAEKAGEQAFLALQCMIGGDLDVYRIPNMRTAYASNGYQKTLDKTNSVIIFNNYMRTNTMVDIELYARRLYNLERTIDVNITAQKTPLIVRCSEEQRAVMKALFKQYEGNEPFIFGDKKLDLKGIEVLPTVAPFVSDKLMQLKFQIWNDAMTFLGISNVNMHKKERLLNDEVTRNMGSTIASRYSRLEMRKKACEQINAMFGLNIDVEYREDVEVLDEQTMMNGSEGSEDE